MPNPPVTIGPFANVPAPGSPIRSDWPQQVSQYFAYKAIFGSRASALAVSAATWTNLVSLTSTGFRAGRYRLGGAVFGASSVAVTGSCRFLTGTGGESPWYPFQSPGDGVPRLICTVGWLYQLLADGSITANLQVNPVQAGLTVQIATWADLSFVGY